MITALKEIERNKKTLGSVLNVTSSKRIYLSEYKKSGIPFFRSKEIIEASKGKLVSSDLYLSQDRYDEIKTKFGVPQKGDILLTSIGTIGIPFRVTDDSPFYFKDGNLTWFKNFNGIDSLYFYYWITSVKGQSQIEMNSIGSSQSALTIDSIKKMEIDLPNLQTQKKIAEILGAYDVKIENNNTIIKNLELTAQTIFDEWFVKFRFPGYEKAKFVESDMGEIPEGWETGSFIDFVDILSGGTPSTGTTEYWDGEIPFFTPKDSDRSFYCLDTEKHITKLGLQKCNSILYPKDTVFITARGTVGKLVLAGRPMAMNQSCYALRSKNDSYSNYFLYVLTLGLIRSLRQVAVGGVFDAITIATFENMHIVKPAPTILNYFEKIIKPMFEQILLNKQENQKLQESRDQLLAELI